MWSCSATPAGALRLHSGLGPARTALVATSSLGLITSIWWWKRADCRRNDRSGPPGRLLQPNTQIELELFDAIRRDDVAKVRRLISRPQDDLDVNMRHSLGWTPLHLAAFLGRTKIVRQLLEAGANPDAIDEFSNASQVAHEHRLDYFSVYRARETEFSDLLASDVSFLGTTALHYACLGGSVETIRVLMEYKANPNLENEFGHRPADYLDDQDPEIGKLMDEFAAYSRDYEELVRWVNADFTPHSHTTVPIGSGDWKNVANFHLSSESAR